MFSGGNDPAGLPRVKTRYLDSKVMRVHNRKRMLAAGRAAITDPAELSAKLVDTLVERREKTHERPVYYEPDANWERHLHELIGASWPCTAIDQFWDLWPDVLGGLRGAGLRVGRGAFGGWGDGEPGITRAAWCLTMHLAPRVVVETGVARGVMSRFILEALSRHGRGHLWSIDLPPLDPELHSQIGAAVPPACRDRWTYVRGASRRHLPKILAQVGEVDLFVHDSRHTERNLRFELDRAWGALGTDGVILADDIDVNRGFESFRRSFGGYQALVCHAEPLDPDPTRQDRRGVFGVIVKTSRLSGSRDGPGAIHP
jgi:hypothetical protein